MKLQQSTGRSDVGHNPAPGQNRRCQAAAIPHCVSVDGTAFAGLAQLRTAGRIFQHVQSTTSSAIPASLIGSEVVMRSKNDLFSRGQGVVSSETKRKRIKHNPMAAMKA